MMRAKRRSLNRTWALLISVSATLASIEIPARVVLQYRMNAAVLVFEWALTIIFLIDLVLNVRGSAWFEGRTGGRPDGGPPHAKTTLVARDPEMWGLIADLLAAVPIWVLPVPAAFQLLRLLKLARVGGLMHHWRQHAVQNANILRLAFFLFWLMLLAHWISCGWLALRGLPPEFNKLTHYVRAIYWCVTTMATVGYGDITPTTNRQMLYAIVVMILGAGVYGYVIANVATILANIDPAKVRYREMVEKLTAFMRYRNIPGDLQQRILDYNAYLWEKRLGYDESAAIAGLPPSLRSEVSLFLNREIIEKVPLFKGATEDFVRAVAMEMRPMIFTPGDYIMRAGEPGSEMYFISRGVVEIVSADVKTVYATLSAGDFFGEMALLFNQRRTASARAADYCDLYMLEKQTFDTILTRFPDFAAHIHEVAGKRQEKRPEGNTEMMKRVSSATGTSPSS